ncbi:chemotaxis protein CheB [Hymenobacter cellulosivorans]|uniref:protein-glutamate methylesterase n=1 Tax=Hymenobacter cellulosivorans TaxID=2932249 RepID=A0ABY4FA50_9BACT|nr:chemotaxis protein CheB [Hymenobacter cellulosivorans]UOQ53544.1 chemotaxis protein CheB [Hymenobacter cellulosivorans]
MTAKKKGAVKRDIVVIGASSGGVLALLEFVRTLPHDFPAPILIVQHMAPYVQSMLPQLLSEESALPAKHPRDGEPLKPGVIYVAPPDHHLLVENDTVLVKRGPKENRFRPSVDALFRSAAYTYGPRVIGVVLTGYLDDGTSGLWCVQRLGGITVVQDPQDAVSPAMPTNALEFVQADHIVPLSELSALLVRLTAETVEARPAVPQSYSELLGIEVKIARNENAFEMGIIDQGQLTAFTCPDCHGALTQLIEGKLIRFRCHTGHAYTISALLSEVSESVESLLYQSMRGLEESKMLLEHLGKYFAKDGQPTVADVFLTKAAHTGKQAHAVRKSISQHQAFSGDLAPEPRPKTTKNK